MHETLDETIDRVAGEMSAVADDPGLTARVRERMNGRRRVWLMPTLAAASVAGIVIAVAMWPGAEQIAAPPRASHERAADVAARVEGGALPLVEGGTSVPPNVESGALPLVEGWTSVPPNMENGALPLVEGGTSVPPQPAMVYVDVEPVGPAPLAIAELTIAPLPGPDSVAIAPLDLAPLDVPELDTTYESKEQR